MNNPNELFKTLTDIIFEMYTFFRSEFRKRNADADNQRVTKEILQNAYFFTKSDHYEFYFHGFKNKTGYITSVKIIMSAHAVREYSSLEYRANIRFQWSNPKHLKMSYSQSKSFQAESLSSEYLLDLVSSFLRGEITSDKKSRERFLRKINACK